MEKRIDEQILDYINAMEAKESRKDIHNGQIKIGGNYYEFEERDFLEEKLKMFIPNNFQDMPLEARKLKYPSDNRPDIIKCNDNGSIAVTFKLIDNPLKEERMEQFGEMMKLINQRLNPANIYFDEGILEVNEKRIGYFDFKSSALDDFLYNFIFFLVFEEKTLMGTFNCIYDEYKEWKEVIFQMLSTIKIVEGTIN